MNTTILTFIEILNVSLLIFLSVISYRIYQKTKTLDILKSASNINTIIANIDIKKINAALDTVEKINKKVCVDNQGVVFPGFDKTFLGNKVKIPEIKMC